MSKTPPITNNRRQLSSIIVYFFAEICPVGQVSEDGLSPCTPCPGGTFQDQPGIDNLQVNL